MAIDSRIALAGQVPKVSQAINIFENALMNSQTRDLRQQQEARRAELAPSILQQAEQGVDINQQTLEQNRNAQRLQNIHQTGQRLKPFLESNDTQGAQQFMLNHIAQLQTRIEAGENIDLTESMETLQKLQSNDFQGVLGDINAVEGLILQQKGRGATQSTPAAIQETEWFNAQTPEVQQTHLKIQRGDKPTFDEQLKHAQSLSNIKTKATAETEDLKLSSQRKSKLISDFSGQVKAAKGTLMKTREIKKLAEKANQGVVGQGQLLASKFFSGIDASDEGALASAYLSLTMDELAKFKGPTTDFEFGVSERITGSLGQGAKANAARIASLSRAGWFAIKEAKQFNEWIDKGHNADRFGFDFNEPMTFGKGNSAITITLQDLRDTAAANHVTIEEAIKEFSKGRG